MTPGPRVLLGWGALAFAVLALLFAWQGQSYWEYSDGVYALSARQLLDGQSLYRDFAAAQPPPLYYAGAAVLALSDTSAAIRVAMALCAAATSLLVLLAVWRLTRRPGVALAAAVAALVTPWALREHGQLLPETLAAPLVLGAALLAGRRGGAVAAGVLGALAASLKVAFLLPALAVVLAARAPRRALIALAASGALAGLALVALFGEPLWTGVVRAQAQTGRASLGYVAGLWAQAGWNLLALVVLAALAWPRRAALADRDLARTLLAAALGALLLLATLLKQGSYLTVLVVAEPPLLCLAACGVAVTPWRRPLSVVVAGAAALALAQTISLLATPADPVLFTRPFAASGPARVLSDREVEIAAAAIRRCPAGTVYAGPPYLAFVAGRAPAGGQPDQFIIARAPILERFRRAAATDPRICPGAPIPPAR